MTDRSRRRTFLCWLLGCRWKAVVDFPDKPTAVQALVAILQPRVYCERCGRTENP